MASGSGPALRWAPEWLVTGTAAFGFMPHFEAFQKGIVDSRDIFYFLSVIIFMLFGTYLVIENRKSA